MRPSLDEADLSEDRMLALIDQHVGMVQAARDEAHADLRKSRDFIIESMRKICTTSTRGSWASWKLNYAGVNLSWRLSAARL